MSVNNFPNSVSRKIFILLFPLICLLAGSLSQAQAATLNGDARWRTDGQDPTYLNLYPLSGRDASSSIFVQADLTGATSVVEDQVLLFLDNPILLPDSFPVYGSVEVIKGNGGEATIVGVLEVENDINWALYTPETVLKLKLVIKDELGAETIFELGDVFLYGPSPGGSLPDVEAPMVIEATVNDGNTIVVPENLEEDEFEFSGSLQVTDVWKGIEGASLFYLHEDGGFFSAISVDFDPTDLISGTLTDGVFTTTSSAGKYIKSGTYELFGFSIVDKSGNELAGFGSNAPEGVQKTVEIVNPNEDPSPPELTSAVIVTPTTGDVTTDPLLLTFKFSAKDEVSGITFGSITVFHSTDEEVTARTYTVLPSSHVVIGDEFMGDYEVPIEIPQGQAAGDYFYQIRLTDGAFQSITYGKVRPGFTFTPEPLLEGSTEMINITNSGSSNLDTTPPVLDSISVAFDDDLAEGPGVMTVTMMISEPESELALFGNNVRLISPTGATDINRTFGIFNRDDETGAYIVTLNLNKAIETGTYCFAVHLENTDGLESDYGQNYDYLPFPGDFPGTWDILHDGPIDYAPPVLVEFTVTPGVVDSETDVNLSVTLRIQDEGTGLQFDSIFQPPTLNLLNGLPGDFGFRQSIFSTQLEDPDTDVRGEGTIFDVTYTFDISLTADQFGGDFLSFSLNLMDCAGNSRTYDSSICNVAGNYPFPYDVVQITTNGNEDPIIISDGGGATAAVNAEENQTTVTTVRVIDTPGDILTRSITGGADAALFDLDPISGVLTFKTAPSFATPTDAGANNVYEVTVEVTDENGGQDSQDISVTVTEILGNRPPNITSDGGGLASHIIVEENLTYVTTVAATDPDLPGDTLTLSIMGGADAALFSIDVNTGLLSFSSAPVFSNPADSDENNVYEVTVKVEDSEGETDTQDISVTVTLDLIDETDYETFANTVGTFPGSATFEQKTFNYDYDGDGQTNGEEFAAGSDPVDPDDYFLAAVLFHEAEGLVVLFGPYVPSTNIYTLYSVFEGEGNNESVPLDVSAQADDLNPNFGNFILPPSQGFENQFLSVRTTKTSL